VKKVDKENINYLEMKLEPVR